MKLEIKHLAPYLPYNLKVSSLHTLNAETGIGNINHIVRAVNEGKKQYKPILRPLSDLSKLGVDDITINEHTINLMIEEKFNEDYGLFEHYKGSLELVKEGDSSQGYDSKKAISFEVFEEIRNELLKGHYDLFGLIEKGLAIDINNLKH